MIQKLNLLTTSTSVHLAALKSVIFNDISIYKKKYAKQTALGWIHNVKAYCSINGKHQKHNELYSVPPASVLLTGKTTNLI